MISVIGAQNVIALCVGINAVSRIAEHAKHLMGKRGE
jgi:hypothetical protein